MIAAAHEGDRRTLLFCLVVAGAVELSVLTAAGWHGHWLAHPQKAGDDSNFVEAQIFEVPKAAHLIGAAKIKAPGKVEATLSKIVAQGRAAKPGESAPEQRNQTEGGGLAAPTHGPVAVFSPAPQIPSYLKDQDLQTSVVIDFLISSLGHATVRLAGSSGNEELDAIALKTAGQWQFKPAEKDHQAVDSKVRLRIVFEVH